VSIAGGSRKFEDPISLPDGRHLTTLGGAGRPHRYGFCDMLRRGCEKENEMDLEHEVRTVMRQSATALTVDQVTQEVADRIKDEVRSILNALHQRGELNSVRGSGPRYRTHYHAAPIERRV